jgi:hypothetical protein
VDFLHYNTRINCLTGAIISETRHDIKYILITKYSPPQCSIKLFSVSKILSLL